MSTTPEREELAARLLDYWKQTLPRQSSQMVPMSGRPLPVTEPELEEDPGFEEDADIEERADGEEEAGSEDAEHAPHASARERPERPVPEVRGSLIEGSGGTLRPREQKVDRAAQPGWATAQETEPRVGDQVYCTAGLATVLRLLGKTGNGSRLLELKLPGTRTRDSFFAAASNVLVAPAVGARAGALESHPQGFLPTAGAPSSAE